jgi:hypothetical protein
MESAIRRKLTNVFLYEFEQEREATVVEEEQLAGCFWAKQREGSCAARS